MDQIKCRCVLLICMSHLMPMKASANVFVFLFRSGIPADVSDERLKNLSNLKENVTSSEASDLFSVVNELANVCYQTYFYCSLFIEMLVCCTLKGALDKGQCISLRHVFTT